MTTPVFTRIPELQAAAADLAVRYGLPLSPTIPDNDAFGLELTLDGLQLLWFARSEFQPLELSFTQGKQAWRQQQGGGRQEAVVRALGIAKGHRPRILDGTAGLGRDGIMLAHAGCSVCLLERHPVIFALLDQAIENAGADEKIGQWVTQRVQVMQGSLIEQEIMPAVLKNFAPEAIYLDPMFPERGKTAAVKKDMQMLQHLVGGDDDADALLPAALALASHRVVVKRPALAPFLAGQTPSSQVTTKKHRFDIYVKQAYGRA
ncbi:MAG: class I SAM-dependent methyltransferase [Idiomarina sp.]|nr:class I SAM-dependent methyltransferase [Idiomarina sp.]